LNEVSLRKIEEVEKWQNRLAKLFSYMLRHGMPMEQLQLGTFQEMLFQSRNSEESLLIALNSCAMTTRQISAIEHSAKSTFGTWLRRIQGHRQGPPNVVAARCLSYLYLSRICLDICDFHGANLNYSNLEGTIASFSCFRHATLHGANLQET